ncbi:MAG: autotransporter outer membrane beta-barrel domain-containing protein [Pasteurellaceae bacterium]|nr:autotransporter outer membrane beta-barrel domain-containing protein [Pasteurellaceae bacterium]
MKKKKLAIILSSLFFTSEFSYADMVAEGSVYERSNAIVGDGLAGKQVDADGYYPFHDTYIGPGNFGKLTVNHGTKLKTGEIHVGNHATGDGTFIVDGLETKVEIIDNRLNVGGSGSTGKLYVKNGAELIQSNAKYDDNYFGYHGGSAFISIEDQGSKLVFNLGRQGIRSVNSQIYLKDGGALEINDQSAYLPHIVNYGNLIAQKPLTVRQYFQIGNDDDTKAGTLNLVGGISLSGKLVVNKLAEPSVTLPINRCYNCNIEHNTNETLILFKNNQYGISPSTLTVNKGKIGIDDQITFDTFKATQLNLQTDATFSLTNIMKAATNVNNAADIKVNDFVHLGTLDLADGSDNPQLTEFTVKNYQGGGELLVDTVWNQEPQTSSSDMLHIKGNIYPTKVTIVRTKSGIIGDIQQTLEEQFSPAVVKVDREHTGNLFTGSAETTNAGEAQLTKRNGSYYWTLQAITPPVENEYVPGGIYAEAVGAGQILQKPIYIDIISKSVTGYIQQPFINRQMGLAQLGKLHERVGEQRAFSWDTIVRDKQLWARMSGERLGLQGKNRFGMNVKSGFVQFGHDMYFKQSENHSHQHAGVILSYGWAQSQFFDQYNAENGFIISDKFTGTAKTDMISLGGYRTYYSPTGAYVDLIGQMSWLGNRYNSYGKRAKQNGYGVGLSIEVGKPFVLLNPKISFEPQAQLTYQGIWLNGFNDGVKQIQRTQQDSLVGRLGVRVNWSKALEQNSPQLYFTTNLLQTLKGRESKITVGHQQVKEAFGDLVAEFGLGGQYPITKNLNLYGDVRYVIGIQDRNSIHRDSTLSQESYHARLGVRYTR